VTAARIARQAAVAALAVMLLTAGPALAAGVHEPMVSGADVFGIGHAVGGVFGGIGHAVLGAFSWTFGLATKFILVTLGAIVKLLIPRSWANQGVQIMQWIVDVPNYAGRITSPTGDSVYGFAGINELRDLFTWIGMALLPPTLVLLDQPRDDRPRGPRRDTDHPRARPRRGAHLLSVLVEPEFRAGQPADAHGAVGAGGDLRASQADALRGRTVPRWGAGS